MDTYVVGTESPIARMISNDYSSLLKPGHPEPGVPPSKAIGRNLEHT